MMSKRKRTSSVEPAHKRSDRAAIELIYTIEEDIRQCGFIKDVGDEYYHPIIQLHPDDAPLDVRDRWMEMYGKVSKCSYQE